MLHLIDFIFFVSAKSRIIANENHRLIDEIVFFYSYVAVSFITKQKNNKLISF